MKEGGPKTILAVIYDPIVRKVIERVVGREGFNSEIVGTLEEARTKITELLPSDAVLTDWTDGSGAGEKGLNDRVIIGREIVELAQGKGVKQITVMNGGSVDTEDLEALKERGITVIPKPFELTQLARVIRGDISEIGTKEDQS